MSYPKQLLRLSPTKGLALDLPANEIAEGYYTGAANAIFRDGFAQRVGGSRAAYVQNTLDPVYHLLNVRAPGGVTESNFWLACGLSEVVALETSNVSDITGSALTPVTSPWQWTSTLLNNLPVLNNTLDPPRYWGGDVGTPLATLPDWPVGTVCKSVAAFKFHIFAFDIDGPSGHFESQMLWSDAAAPGAIPTSWTASATNEAGDAILADTPGPIMTAHPLGGTLIVFKRSSAYAIEYVGGEDIFTVRLLDAARGALTRHSVVDIGGMLLVVGDGDVWLTDGVNWRSIAFGRVRNYLFTQLDQASYENLHVVYNRAKNEVRIRIPVTGNTFASEELVYSVSADAWGLHTVVDGTCAAVGIVNDTAPDESWDGDAEVWDNDNTAWNAANFSLAVEQLLTGADAATLTLEDASDATDHDATLTRHDLTMGDAERFKFVRRVHARTNQTPGTLYIRVGARNSITEAITWHAEQVLAPPDSFINVRVLGRFISVEVRSEDSDVWLFTSLDLEYEMRGYK